MGPTRPVGIGARVRRDRRHADLGPAGHGRPDAKQQADTETIHSRPQRLADKPLPPHQKYDPKFTSIALGRMHERMAPSSVRLPDAVVKGVQKAWEKSAKDGNEYGGNIVRTYGGAYEMKHGGQHSDDDEWMPNEKDTGFGGDMLGFVHTHPYHQEGYEFGTFSDADVANLCDYDTRLSIVRSGRYTFMLVKTKEFDEKMHREVESEKDPGRLVEKRERFKADMMRCWNAASNAHEGSFPDKLEAGVLAVCEKYHLVYYAGEGAQLGLRSPRKKQ